MKSKFEPFRSYKTGKQNKDILIISKLLNHLPNVGALWTVSKQIALFRRIAIFTRWNYNRKPFTGMTHLQILDTFWSRLASIGVLQTRQYGSLL